ncbi:MAG: hypothetical protein JOY54_09300 [Acidobacteriaceae bacterium]|nr:hypothetical protein [Acidobacteriaceae bacterium]
MADAASSNVTLIKIINSEPDAFQAEVYLTTGSERWNIVASPDSRHIFFVNSGQDTITVIDAESQTIIGSVDLPM